MECIYCMYCICCIWIYIYIVYDTTKLSQEIYFSAALSPFLFCASGSADLLKINSKDFFKRQQFTFQTLIGNVQTWILYHLGNLIVCLVWKEGGEMWTRSFPSYYRMWIFLTLIKRITSISSVASEALEDIASEFGCILTEKQGPTTLTVIVSSPSLNRTCIWICVCWRTTYIVH